MQLSILNCVITAAFLGVLLGLGATFESFGNATTARLVALLQDLKGAD